MKQLVAIGLTVALSACATAPVATSGTAPAPRAAPSQPPAAMQWLYGSGEAGVASIQAYHGMRDYVLGAARVRPADSVIMAAGATLDQPRFEACGNKPLAVVLDIDETALLNLGYEYDEASRGRSYDQEIWDRWEQAGPDKLAPVPGAVTAIGAIRNAGVAVIFNSNRKAENAAFTEKALSGNGLGAARHGETLYLQGDISPGSAKDPRRAAIAGRYCVVAMAGDQLGDFSDLFNARTLSVADRRRAATAGMFAQKWGAGWFMLPNPVYGPGIKGSFDDIFPTNKRWTDPAGKEPK